MLEGVFVRILLEFRTPSHTRILKYVWDGVLVTGLTLTPCQGADSSRARPKTTMRISDLSRISGLSPRMLRHYDEIGLFRPALVLVNGYRE